jgi:hypothetical protein
VEVDLILIPPNEIVSLLASGIVYDSLLVGKEIILLRCAAITNRFL